MCQIRQRGIHEEFRCRQLNVNTFAASYLNTQSTKVDVGDFKHELLNRLRSTMAVNVLRAGNMDHR